MLRLVVIALLFSVHLSSACGDDGGGAQLSPAEKLAAEKKLAAIEAAGTNASPKSGDSVDEEEIVVSNRPKKILTRDDFGVDMRDPFQDLNRQKTVETVSDQPRQSQRSVKMRDTNFEDLSLVAIVTSRHGVPSQALWEGADGRSVTVQQGEYFSRAEVLLAAVNRDYVEIEVVDEVLAEGLNLERGERRAIYLKNE